MKTITSGIEPLAATPISLNALYNPLLFDITLAGYGVVSSIIDTRPKGK